MRALLFCLLGLATAFPDLAFAQMKLPSKTTPGAAETRYFTAIDGLMEGNADVVLKETRQGKNVTAAVLDVCYPAEKGSDRKDRFIANLAVNGQSLTGTTQTLTDKLPVSVKLQRKQSGDSFEFRGQITIGQAVTEVTSTDNSDLSEKEFLESQTTDDAITRVPKDCSEISTQSVALRTFEPCEVLLVKRVSVRCDARQELRKRDTGVMRVGSAAADARGHQNRTRQNGAGFEDGFFGRNVPGRILRPPP